jgi:DsbC/DsbD-like thiol-disulfide interchange protein
MTRPAAAALLALCASVACGIAEAGESAWSRDTGAAARLISAGRKSPGVLSAGVQVRLDPGYKTYWRFAGDAGVPPLFDWTGSDNLAEARVLFPAPRSFADGNGRSLGYKEEVVFPLEIVPADPSKPVRLQLVLDYAVCDKICVPAKAAATLTLDPGATVSPTLVRLVDAHEKRVPKPAALAAGGPLAIEKAAIEGAGKDGMLVVIARGRPGSKLELAVEAPEALQPATHAPEVADAAGLASFRLALPEPEKAPGAAIVLTLGDGERAVEVPVTLGR